MNQGMYNGLVDELRNIHAQLDQIRLILQRMDVRDRNRSKTEPTPAPPRKGTRTRRKVKE